ncbi:MAG: nuclear transport factor 2 family protein [Pseudobacteriovorax sp.]|nr:nuclear transport factor 2 family protein [Pseudobacteriovorax sp.]
MHFPISLWLIIMVFGMSTASFAKKKYEGLFKQENARLAYVNALEGIPKNDLKKRVSAIKPLLKSYPNSPYIKAMVVVLEGDLSQLESLYTETIQKKRTVEVLSSLIPEAKGLDPWFLSFLRNEIAYHSGDFYQQYLLGVEEVAEGVKGGHFSIGVGASEYAYELLSKGYLVRAMKFATISVNALKTYEKPWETGDHFYTQALAISGDQETSETIYKKVASSHIDSDLPWDERYEKRLDIIKNSLSKDQSKWPPAVVVQKQAEAYNSKDLESFLKLYHKDAILNREGTGQNDELKGHKEIRKVFGNLFKKATHLHAYTASRKIIGNKVIDEEITKMTPERESRVFAIYTIENGLITRINFYR